MHLTVVIMLFTSLNVYFYEKPTMFSLPTPLDQCHPFLGPDGKKLRVNVGRADQFNITPKNITQIQYKVGPFVLS